MNFYNVRRKKLRIEQTPKYNYLHKIHAFFFMKFFLSIYPLLILTFYCYKGCVTTLFWEHLVVNNFNLNLVFFFLFVNWGVILLVYFFLHSPISYLSDFFFSVMNLSVVVLLIFLSNNLLAFFFITEVVVCFIFYKLVSSKLWYKVCIEKKNDVTGGKVSKNNKTSPKNFLNTLFFQYWASFFSSVLFLFFLISLLYLFGDNNWEAINALIYFENTTKYFDNNFFFSTLFFVFVISFFLKTGLTPLHIFKIEVYKNIPFLSIFFYTIYYFLVYIVFFALLFLFFFSGYYSIYAFIYIFIIIFGGAYIISLMFDVSLTKAFFAYSTILNSLLFLTIVFAGLQLS